MQKYDPKDDSCLAVLPSENGHYYYHSDVAAMQEEHESRCGAASKCIAEKNGEIACLRKQIDRHKEDAEARSKVIEAQKADFAQADESRKTNAAMYERSLSDCALLIARLQRAEDALRAALVHSIANIGTSAAFYKCYTYPCGLMPEWVKLAQAYFTEAEKTPESNEMAHFETDWKNFEAEGKGTEKTVNCHCLENKLASGFDIEKMQIGSLLEAEGKEHTRVFNAIHIAAGITEVKP
jgi:hypothetical protein